MAVGEAVGCIIGYNAFTPTTLSAALPLLRLHSSHLSVAPASLLAVALPSVYTAGGPVGPSGKALLGWLGPRFESASALLSLQKLWSVETVLFVTVSLTINETLKWFSSLPISVQESFRW